MRKPRQTEDDRRNLALRIEASNLDDPLIAEAKVITDTTGSHITIFSLLERAYYRCGAAITVEGEAGSKLAHLAHRTGLAFVLSRSTLERFGVETVSGLVKKIGALFNNTRHESQFARVKWFDELADAAPALSDSFITLQNKDLTVEERGYVLALTKGAERLVPELWRYRDHPVRHRTIHLGVCDCADAWTDGRDNVTVNRTVAPLLKQGLKGCIRLAGLLLHEFLHDSSDAGSHVHDVEFYEAFHDISLDSDMLGLVASAIFNAYLAYCRRTGAKITSKMISMADLESGLTTGAYGL